MSDVFKNLNSVNVNEHTEKKSNLTYLSWAWAWAEVKKQYPCAEYEIIKFNGLPYVCDPMIGYMVYTKVTIEEIAHEMWLPVMDSSNKAMKQQPYSYKTKYGDKHVLAATMFDINKTIMRCLTKNLAMHGLGLYIYSGEDLPEIIEEIVEQKQPATMKEYLNSFGIDENKVMASMSQNNSCNIQQGQTIENLNKDQQEFINANIKWFESNCKL